MVIDGRVRVLVAASLSRDRSPPRPSPSSRRAPPASPHRRGPPLQGASDENLFIKQVLYGVVRHKNPLKSFMSCFFNDMSVSVLRSDYTLYMILAFLIVFRLKELTFAEVGCPAAHTKYNSSDRRLIVVVGARCGGPPACVVVALVGRERARRAEEAAAPSTVDDSSVVDSLVVGRRSSSSSSRKLVRPHSDCALASASSCLPAACRAQSTLISGGVCFFSRSGVGAVARSLARSRARSDRRAARRGAARGAARRSRSSESSRWRSTRTR